MNDNLENLVSGVIEWAKEKGILEHSSADKQMQKTIEELGELSKAIQSEDAEQIKLELGDVIVCLIIYNELQFVESIVDTIDEIRIAESEFNRCGKEKDALFSLVQHVGTAGNLQIFADELTFYPAISIAKHYGFEFETALESALAKIQKRTGKMINGVFVKDER